MLLYKSLSPGILSYQPSSELTMSSSIIFTEAWCVLFLLASGSLLSFARFDATFAVNSGLKKKKCKHGNIQVKPYSRLVKNTHCTSYLFPVLLFVCFGFADALLDTFNSILDGNCKIRYAITLYINYGMKKRNLLYLWLGKEILFLMIGCWWSLFLLYCSYINTGQTRIFLA